MALVNVCFAVALVAGAFGLTVSASDFAKAKPDFPADPPTYEQQPDPPGVPLACKHVEIPEAGLGLEVPISWQQLAQEPAWSPTGDGKRRIGISWYHLLSDIRPEAILLPGGGHIVESAPIVLGWGSGREYLVKDYGPSRADEGAGGSALSVEMHVIVAVVDGETQWAYDLHAVAPTEEELAALKPVLKAMLGSMHLTTPSAVGTSR
jgi:hypothetical protein